MEHSRKEKDTRNKLRKDDHLRINQEEDVQSGLFTGLDSIQFEHSALPEINLSDIDTSLVFLNRQLKFPLLISSMTGGTSEGKRINQILAQSAEVFGIGMGVGSQRVGIENPETMASFNLRRYAPNTLLLANLGAIQLNYGYGIDECRQAVDSIGADGLILHLNPLQEAIQPGGNTNFSNLLNNIESICRKLPVPVIVKEVGWGISSDVARQLSEAGVAAIDVAGAGGTSWSQVEMYRIKDELGRNVAKSFRDWGIPTLESIRQVHSAVPAIPVIASGGLRSGVDLAKCIALGATMGGMAGPLLRAAAVSPQMLADRIEQTCRELIISMFATGSKNLDVLKQARFVDRRQQ
jgi:isopentenyl-diphosphate Delta-isomerase